MRKSGSILLAMVALLPAAPASAADTLAVELQPLAFLAGACWRGTLPANQGTDVHCFTPILGGHFLRDRHIVTPSHYSGETLYRWDAAARQIRFDYYASDGMLMIGTAAAADGGLSFDIPAVSFPEPVPAMRVAWRRDGADAYVVTTEIRGNDGWHATPGSARFQRVGAAPSDQGN